MLFTTKNKPNSENYPFRLIRNQIGTSLTEVMIAVVVFLIIMVGGLNYFLLPQSTIARQKIKRVAISAAQRRMESLLALSFSDVTTDSNETDTAVLLGSITALRSTTVTLVDDAADGLSGADSDADTVDFKSITVDLSWNSGGNREVSYTTIISDVEFYGDETAPGGQFPSWSRKCELVVQSTQVPGNLYNFPLLLTEDTLPSEMLDADGGYAAANGGGDVRFSADSSGVTRLSCEIVKFVTDNDPANGEVEVWVNVPFISATSNTSIWVWYDKPGQTQPAEVDSYGSESVWDSNYLMVLHMNEDPTTSSPQFQDATSSDYNGSNNGGLTSSDLLDAVIDKGIEFDGSTDDDIDLGIWDVIGSGLTVEHWVWLNSNFSADGRFLSRTIGASVSDHWLMTGIDETDNTPRFRLRTGGTTTNLELSISDSLTTNAWHFMAATYDGSKMRIWINDEEKKNTSKSGTISTSGTVHTYLGDNPTGLRQLEGRLDEVRVSDVRRPDTWLESEYNNQLSPGTFVVEGTPKTP